MRQNKQIYAIPLPKHLVRFCKKAFWEGRHPPFSVDERSLLGKQIFTALVDRRTQDTVISEDSTCLEVSLSEPLARRSPNLAKLSRINRYLEEYFKNAMVIWVKAQMQLGNNRYQALVGFLEYYDVYSDELHDRYYQYVMRCQNLPFRIKKNEKEKETNELG